MNKEIKIRPNKKEPKVLARATIIPKQILHKTAEKSKDQLCETAGIEAARDDTPQNYAEDKIRHAEEQTVSGLKDSGHYTVKQIKSKIKSRLDNAKTIMTDKENPASSKKSKLTRAAEKGYENITPSVNKREAEKAGVRKDFFSNKEANHKAAGKIQNNKSNTSDNITEPLKKGTVKTRKTARKSIKKSEKTVKKATKTAVKTSKSAIKTAKRAAKSSVKAVKETAKATQAAARAARFATKAAKTAIKILQAIIKAVIKAIQALVQLIAAGGWVAVLVILIVVVVVVIIVFLLGIFFAEDSGGLSIKDTITETNAAFELAIQTQIDNLSVDEYDKINIIYDGNMEGNSDSVNNWRDILIIFAAQRMGLGESAIELTEESKAELIHLFYSMNDVSYRTEIVTQTVSVSENTDDDGETEESANEVETEAEDTITVLNIFVTIKSKTWEEEAEVLMFDESQMQIAEELSKPEYYSMFADLIGDGLFDKESIGDLKDIISGLPKGQSGSAAVELALTRIGDPYSQPDRGKGNSVDCSYLVWWAYQQFGINLPTTSVEQAKYCADNGLNVDHSELQPGDLVFWSKTTCNCGRWNEIHHVGIYIGNNKVVEASSSKGCVVVSELWGLNGGKWQVHSYGRVS